MQAQLQPAKIASFRPGIRIFEVQHFYRQLIARADELYKAHLAAVQERKKQQEAKEACQQREQSRLKRKKGKGK